MNVPGWPRLSGGVSPGVSCVGSSGQLARGRLAARAPGTGRRYPGRFSVAIHRRRPRAACLIVSNGGSRLVQIRSEAAPWWTRTSSPSTTSRPALPCRGHELRLGGPVDQVHHDVSSLNRIGSEVERSLASARSGASPDACSSPTDGRVDEQLEASSQRPVIRLALDGRRPRARPRAPRPSRGCGSRPRRRRRPRERPDRGAGGAAGAEHERALPCRRFGQRAIKPGRVGVLGRDPAVGEAERVGGADRAPPRREALVGDASAASLCGTVTLTPANPSPGSARTRASKSLRRDLDRLVATTRPPSPSSASAAVCIAGESECETGWPMTASVASAI